jgi:chemotaxis-related protein WspB
MLALAFQVGRNRYALPCASVVELVPLVELRALPKAPPAIAGAFTYRGTIVPVVDLAQLMLGTASAIRLSTRIAVVNISGGAALEKRKRNAYGAVQSGRESESPAESSNRLIGLLAERMFDTVVLDQKLAIDDGLHIADAPYLGDVYLEGTATVQLLVINKLIGGPLDGLFADGALS